MTHPDERPTPETDARIQPRGSPFACVPADFARRLERERDEARAERDALKLWAEKRDADCAAAWDERDALLVDAERYRWLRSHGTSTSLPRVYGGTPMEALMWVALDKEVDASLAAHRRLRALARGVAP